MKRLKSVFVNFFTSAKSAEEKMNQDIYREWTKQRSLAAKYGPHHVDEIDAIFSRAGY